jgi:hypothetical protein
MADIANRFIKTACHKGSFLAPRMIVVALACIFRRGNVSSDLGQGWTHCPPSTSF